MTREEMIRDVCESHIQRSVILLCPDAQKYWCHECHEYGISDMKNINHDNNCSVGYAEQLLAEPVIEVGDVVKWRGLDDEFEVYYIEKTKKSSLCHIINLVSGERHYVEFDLTLVRKGGGR